MLIRPKGWWPPPHVVDALTESEQTQAVDWLKNKVNALTRMVTSKELKDALVDKIEQVTGRQVALPAYALNAIVKRVDAELRQAEIDEELTPGP